jgi:hypothetical protein
MLEVRQRGKPDGNAVAGVAEARGRLPQQSRGITAFLVISSFNCGGSIWCSGAAS